MGYMHIENLYKSKNIMLFKDCYALEKVHGTSCHIGWDGTNVHYFAGESLGLFMMNFKPDEIKAKFLELYGPDRVTLYGEGYGGKCQKMSGTYGNDYKFVVFDVKYFKDPEDTEGYWLNVPAAEAVAHKFGLEFVHYVQIPCTLEEIDKQRDADSVQAIRCNMGSGKKREAVVLRPLIELTYNNGGRIISKHKRDDFSEVRTPRVVTDAELQVFKNAEDAANEFVTAMRLQHVLQKFPEDVNIESTGEVIKAMVEDVIREGAGELIDTKELRAAISKKTALMYKNLLRSKITEKVHGS